MDGAETLRRIRADGRGLNSDSVFILLTADDGDDIRGAAIEEGFSDHLSKPFRPSMLENIIRKYLPEEKLC